MLLQCFLLVHSWLAADSGVLIESFYLLLVLFFNLKRVLVSLEKDYCCFLEIIVSKEHSLAKIEKI